jgi:hypothetical protein
VKGVDIIEVCLVTRFYRTKEDPAPAVGQKAHLRERYRRLRRQFVDYGDDASGQTKKIGSRIRQIDTRKLKVPWNVLYSSHEMERKFSELLLENAGRFDAFVKMPNNGG